MVSTSDRGRDGEARAAGELTAAGYQIIERNFRCKRGEIDLICREGHTLVFVEVRTRATARYGYASETITSAKQRRLAQVAEYYLALRRPQFQTCRFDVVDITAGRVEILRDAFRLGI